MEIQINKAISMPTTGSLLGGKLTITGKGLPESWPDSNWIIQIKSANTQMLITVNVLSTSPTQLVLAMPPSTGDTFTISITDPANVIYTNRYTQSLASTPTINLTSTTTTVASGSASTFTLNRTSPSASILPTLVSLVPTMNIAE